MSLFLENKWSDGLSGSVRVLYVVNCPSTEEISYYWLNARTSLHDHQEYIISPHLPSYNQKQNASSVLGTGCQPYVIVNFPNVNVIVNLMVVVVLFGISGIYLHRYWERRIEIYEYSKQITKIILTQSSATATAIVLSLCIDKRWRLLYCKTTVLCKELMCDDLMIRSCFSTSHRRWIHHACHLRSTIGRIYSVYDSYSTAYIYQHHHPTYLFFSFYYYIFVICVWGSSALMGFCKLARALFALKY